jgi:hypothetical protein
MIAQAPQTKAEAGLEDASREWPAGAVVVCDPWSLRVAVVIGSVLIIGA